MNALILIFIFLIGFRITYSLIYWFMIFLLALINSNAKYDETSRKTILILAKKDKTWRDVARLLDLESEVK